MKKEQPKPYTTTPRSIPSDVRSGEMKSSEWRVYQWLRINADPFGKVATSLASIKNDIFPEVSTGYINNLLLSLKKKGYLYYEERKGRRGSFDVKFGDWLLPKGGIAQIEKYFGKSDGALVLTEADATLEQAWNSAPRIQRLMEQKDGLIKAFSLGGRGSQYGGHYNDTDREKENESTLAKNEFKKIRVGDFTANNYEENFCRELAIEVGEEFMNPLLSVLRKNGLSVIERAAGVYKEDKRLGKRIEEPPRYLFGIIKKLLNPDA